LLFLYIFYNLQLNFIIQIKLTMNKLFTAILLISVLLISGCYLTKKSESYYGINTANTKNVLFIIDISGSMEGKAETDAQGKVISKTTEVVGNKVADKIGGLGGQVVKKATTNQLTKLGKAKKELIPTIRGLSEGTKFNIIIFEDKVKVWGTKLFEANSTNKGLALAYLEKLESGGGTNIYESVEKAFQIAGPGAKDGTTAMVVETIFLLSDGEPTSGAITNTTEICEKIRSWNPKNRVIIHTIGLGEDCDKEFMKKIASENGGTFIDK